MPDIRLMRRSDVPFGLELCRLAGWNQLAPDWERLLALNPNGVFLAEEDGRACGTASTICHGTRTAWIGMVLVHPDSRRRGIGSALMARCIEHLQSRGIESIKLDATDQGRPVYQKLGFRDERPSCRLAGRRPGGLAAGPGVRPPRADDWPAIARMDEEAFGAGRLALLRHLSEEGPAVVVDDGRGCGFARAGHLAPFVGPIVAQDAVAARRLAEALLAQLPEGEVFWDLLPDNAAALELAESLGFGVVRRLTRMYLGDVVHPGDASRIYGAAGFELG